MKQSIFEVLSNEALTDNVFQMILAGDTSHITNCGQFVNIQLDGMFLRRPISVCDYDENTLTIIYKVVGKGTEAMSAMKAGTRLDLLTGLGNGYDRTMTRAVYKALQASGMHLQNYGTVFATIADKDKEEALPLIRRFYQLGFNIEATIGTALFLKQHGIRTHALAKISDGSDEIPNAMRQGHIAYFINTKDPGAAESDGAKLRLVATEYNVTMFTALDTVKVLLDVLEETTLTISTIDAR